MKHKKLRDESGVSMIIAVVFFLVISLACLTLFHAASGAIKEAQRYAEAQKAEILSGSMSAVVQKLIDNGVDKLEGQPYSVRKRDINGNFLSDGRELLKSNNVVAAYILDNLDNGWAYYNEDQALYSDKAVATKTLTLEGIENQGATGEISMYWTWDSESKINYDYTTRKLFVTVTIYVGEEKASTTSVFMTETANPYQYSDRDEESKEQYFWWKYDGEMR